MPFRFDIQFAGLCHFIENQAMEGASEKRCKICVLVPDTPPRVFSKRHHEPKLVYPTSALAEKPPAGSAQLGIVKLRNKRVAFRFRPAEGQALPSPDLLGHLEGTVAVEQLVDTDGQYIDFATDTPHPSIAAKILLEHGTLREAPRTGKWRLKDQTSTGPEFSLPPFVTVTVMGVERVEVVLTPIGGGIEEVVAFEQPLTSIFGITITADCEFLEPGTMLAATIQDLTFDEDFGAHYQLFLDLEGMAPDHPVPVQLPPPVVQDSDSHGTRGRVRERQLAIKPEREDANSPPIGGGGPLSVNPRNGLLLASGGGSACQNGKRKSPFSFAMDTQLS